MVPTPNSYLLVERIPNAQPIICPDAGHASLFQHPKTFVHDLLTLLRVQETGGPDLASPGQAHHPFRIAWTAIAVAAAVSAVVSAAVSFDRSPARRDARVPAARPTKEAA